MSRLISEILNAPEPRFNHTLHTWEKMSGQTGHDVRLISDIARKRKKALGELNLDQTDTTPRELYHALVHKSGLTNQALMAELKITDADSPEQVLDIIIKFIDTLTIKREVWTIKHSVIKQLLKKQCPKKLLKVLGLRSIDSVLKRINAYELLTLSYHFENEEWVSKMRGQYKKLKPIDFQAYSSSIFIVDKERVEKLYKGGYQSSRIIVPNYETGTVLVVPPVKRFNMDVLALTLTLLQVLYDIRIYSAYFRLISVQPAFGIKLQKALHDGLPGNMRDMEIGWAVLQRHFMASPDSFAPIEQPHLQHDDILLVSPLEALSGVMPDLDFWNDYSHVFLIDGRQPVSMHILDVVTNASNKLPYERAVYMHLQQKLWEELGLRYAQHDELRESVIKKLEDE